MLIGFTYDLRDDYLAAGFSTENASEFDSAETIAAITAAIVAQGRQVESIGNIKALVSALAQGKRWDLVFNIAEGVKGLAREAQVPALLEAYDIPYTFSTPEVMVRCHDKALAKLIVQQAGLATTGWQVVRQLTDIDQLKLAYPLFAKPVAEGTGKGVSSESVVHTPEQLANIAQKLLIKFAQPVLVETYLPGREFTVGIIGTGNTAKFIGVLEVIALAQAELGGHTYHNKEHCETLIQYTIPRDQQLAQAVGELAVNAWRALECRDAGRVDIRCDTQGRPHFLEVNPLAGLHPTRSDLIILATQLGIQYDVLLGNILQAAMERLFDNCA